MSPKFLVSSFSLSLSLPLSEGVTQVFGNLYNSTHLRRRRPPVDFRFAPFHERRVLLQLFIRDPFPYGRGEAVIVPEGIGTDKPLEDFVHAPPKPPVQLEKLFRFFGAAPEPKLVVVDVSWGNFLKFISEVGVELVERFPT